MLYDYLRTATFSISASGRKPYNSIIQVFRERTILAQCELQHHPERDVVVGCSSPETHF